MKELTVEATVRNIPAVTDFVDEALDTMGCSQRIQTQINIAIDELFSNIAHYAYNPATGPATVQVEVEKNPLAVVVTFIDRGKPYDPLSAREPDLSLDLMQRPVGGLGIFLVRRTMDDVSYEYRDGRNILRIKKHI